MRHLDKSSPLLSLRPFVDSVGVLRVGGRQQHSQMSYSKKHSIILHHKHHHLTRLIVCSEHLVTTCWPGSAHDLSQQSLPHTQLPQDCSIHHPRMYHLLKTYNKAISQMTGQLPITPGPVFDKIGIDIAGPCQVKYARVRKPVIIKPYVCLFASLSVKAVYLQPASDLTTDAFIAALRRSG